MNDMRKFMKLVESVPFGGGEMCIDCRGMGTNERGEECERCEGFGEVYDDDPQHSGFYDADEYVDDWTCKECGSPNIPEEKDHCPVCGSSWDEQNGFAEDCDETPEGGEDGECSPFTHADDNVDMVHEDDEDRDYHEEWVQHFVDMGKSKLWSLYNETLEDEDYPGRSDELQHMEAALERMGIEVAEAVAKEDFLAPKKDAEDTYDTEEGEDDWDARAEPELDRQTNFDAPSRFDGDDSFDFDLDEQGPGDEDEFDFDDDAMVDVGDDEDYEVFDFDDEFDKMMGNTYRFDEEVVEMNELRKRAGLKVDEAKSAFPNLAEWWNEDPDEIMSFAYWRKGQLPPSKHVEGNAWERNWYNLAQSLAKKNPPPADYKMPEKPEPMEQKCSRCGGRGWWPANDEACPKCDGKGTVVETMTEGEGATCSRCRKGTMERGETFFGPAERCNHCNWQRQLRESTDSRDDYVAFTFPNEKAYFLVADECGEMMEFGMQDEMLLPDQWVDQVLVMLKDHGFEKGKDFSVAGMEEDLQNGYNDRNSVDGEYGDRFPQGATSSPARELGPAGAKHGDNPMRTPMASVDKKEDDIYESYRHQYRRFRRNK